MKKSLLLATLVGIVHFKAQAIPTHPRDLTCVTPQGQVALKSNNGFWSQAQNGRYHVSLVVTTGNTRKTLIPIAVNNEAQRVRGNDRGLREYVFASTDGQKISLALEFNAPYGVATSIKTFRGISETNEVIVSADRDTCEVIFYPKTEI